MQKNSRILTQFWKSAAAVFIAFSISFGIFIMTCILQPDNHMNGECNCENDMPFFIGMLTFISVLFAQFVFIKHRKKKTMQHILHTLMILWVATFGAHGAGLPLFSESFGDIKNPAILLNAGAGEQAIIWPDAFCEQLANKGYFVMRYDYRDSGLSPTVEYDKKPYTVLDMADDALQVLRQYGVKKAHFVGYSMGGQLAQLVGAYRPDHALSLILMGTSTNFQPGFEAFEGRHSKASLSPPQPFWVAWATRKVDGASQSLAQKIDDYVETLRLLDGQTPDFDAPFFHNQARAMLTRTPLQTPHVNHVKAMRASYALHASAPARIKVPTLIIQGSNDPVFGPDHGAALHSAIKGSELITLKTFAHAISPQNFEPLASTIDAFIRKH